MTVFIIKKFYNKTKKLNMFKKVPKLIKKGQLLTALNMCNKLIDF